MPLQYNHRFPFVLSVWFYLHKYLRFLSNLRLNFLVRLEIPIQIARVLIDAEKLRLVNRVLSGQISEHAKIKAFLVSKRQISATYKENVLHVLNGEKVVRRFLQGLKWLSH